MNAPDQKPRSSRLSGSVWALGIVSMFSDIASEMVTGLLPIVMVTVLGTSAATVGLMEGLASACVMAGKIFSGSLSDYFGKRRAFVFSGYALAALSKPMMAAAASVGWVFSARLMDRVGKGVREAPRDALIADVTPRELRGAAFGLRQALDTVGAFIGPLLAMALMLIWQNDYRLVFWVACIPAFLTVVVVYFWVREPENLRPSDHAINPFSGHVTGQFKNRAFLLLLLTGAALSMARFSDAFLLLRANDQGLPLAWTPLVWIVMNAVDAALSYPFGKLADRMDHYKLLALSLPVLMAAHACMYLGGNTIWLGIALWGLHLAMTQGLLSALVAHMAPQNLRGTAYAIFYLVTGLSLLLSSSIAGLMWDKISKQAPFAAGGFWCVVALLLVFAVRRFAAPERSS